MVRFNKSLIFVSALAIGFAAPVSRDKKNKTEYDFGKFDAVYDQRQNGTENYKIDINGVVFVWTPPQTLIQAALLLDPQLFEGEYPDVESILNNHSEKPEDILIVRPEKTTTTSTTSTTEAPVTNTTENEITTQKLPIEVKRKFRLPGFMRPFVTRMN